LKHEYRVTVGDWMIQRIEPTETGVVQEAKYVPAKLAGFIKQVDRYGRVSSLQVVESLPQCVAGNADSPRAACGLGEQRGQFD